MSYYNNFNPYQNPYMANQQYQTPYNNYQQPNANQYQQPQPQPQVAFMPLTFTSGLVGAKAYIVAPNQTVFLKDSDENSNLLFEKHADQYGKYTLKAYELSEINVDEIGKEKVEKPKNLTLTREDMQDFATKQDLRGLFNDFEEKVNSLSSLLEKSLKAKKSSVGNAIDRGNE